MRLIRIGVLMLLAASMASGIVVATATATEGEFLNSKGEAPTKNHFTGKSGEVVFESTGGTKVKCSSSTITGVVKSKTEAEATTVYSGCEEAGIACHTEGRESGKEWFTTSWAQRRDRIGGELLSYWMFLIFGKSSTVTCGTLTDELKGGFLMHDGESQEKKLKTGYSFTANQSKGIQEPLEFEDSKEEKLRITQEWDNSGTGKEEEIGQALKQEITFEEAVELK